MTPLRRTPPPSHLHRKQPKMRTLATLCTLSAVLFMSGCGLVNTPLFGPLPSPTPMPAAQLDVEVISTRPHDPTAFTEGLVLYNDHLYESSGQFGASFLREVDPMTGAVLRKVDLAPEDFAEGLAAVDDRLIQLTWQGGRAFVYDSSSFSLLEVWQYEGEGWGLCSDGSALYMSNGTHTLTRHDAKTFAVLGSVNVTQEGQPVTMLNELECVGDVIYANVWQTDHIVRIDKNSGQVSGVVDASGLLTSDERTAAGPDGVLNGIAYDPASQTFLITGKYWPWLFEVRFVQP